MGEKKNSVTRRGFMSGVAGGLAGFSILMLVSMLCMISIVSIGVAGNKSVAPFDLFAFDKYMTIGDYNQHQVRADTLKKLDEI